MESNQGKRRKALGGFLVGSAIFLVAAFVPLFRGERFSTTFLVRFSLIQAPSGRPVEFRPEEHTDFIFYASDEAKLAGLIVVFVVVISLWWYYRRRRPGNRDGGHDPRAT
jgi:hypothetical protein